MIRHGFITCGRIDDTVNGPFELTIRENGEAVQSNLIGQRGNAAASQDSTARFQLTSTQPPTQTLGGRSMSCQSSRVWASRLLEMAR